MTRRRAVARGIALALLIVFTGCLGSAVINQAAYSKVVVKNQEWQDATVHLYCGISRIKTYKVTATTQHTDYVALVGCYPVFATAKLLASPRYFTRSENIVGVTGDDEIVITVLHNLNYLDIARFP